MLYMVRMDVKIPHDLSEEVVTDIKLREKNYAQELQKNGQWLHLWRIAGEFANYSIFDVESHDALHDLLSKLPLFPYMQIKVTPLARHPSAIE